MTIPKISVDEFDRDKRITDLERQVLMLTAQVYARDSALSQILHQMLLKDDDDALNFVDQIPGMLAEIDIQVMASITEADQVKS